MNTVIIIQARMGSTRLPGKSLMSIHGKPMIQHVFDRLSTLPYQKILATTTSPKDDPLESYASQHNIPFYRGSEHDVLGRYYEAAKQANADVIVRITGDCPLIDPQIVEEVVSALGEGIDYASNTLERTYPRGLDVEVFPFKVLEEAYTQAKDPSEREHVTPFIYRHPERYRLYNVKRITNVSQHRWTVDTPEDLELIKKIYAEMPSQFTLKDVLELFKRKPELYAINAHIKQKST